MFKPTRPDDVNARLARITSMKAPHFFIYAKKKDGSRVQRVNDSAVNRLESIVPNKRMSFSAKNIGVFRYQHMLSNPSLKVSMLQDVVDLYNEIEKQYRYAISFYDDMTNLAYVRDMILERFAELGHDMENVCDVLVKYLFHTKQSKRKNVFWMCFGDVVLTNLRNNLPDGSIQCKKCGERFVPISAQQKLCNKCAVYHPIVKKIIRCIDCGKDFDVDGIVKNKKRCDTCQAEKVRVYEREKKRRQRQIA